MNGLLSIIVPVFNGEKYIKKCLESIINQEYKNIEIIVVDDGSTDNSLSICRNFSKIDNRIKIVTKENGGVSSSRNIGLQMSSGDLLAFVDCDDVVSPHIYASIIPDLIENNYDLVSFGINKVDENGNILSSFKWNKEKVISSAKDFYEYFFASCGWVYNKIYRRELLNGLFFDESILFDEDVFFTLSYISKLKKIYVSSDIGYNRTIRAGSLSNHSLNNSSLEDINNSILLYRLLSEAGYSWLGAYRVCKSARRVVSRIPLNDWSEYLVYINACQDALKKIKIKDFISYSRKSSNKVTQDIIMKISVRLWLKYRKHKAKK